MLPMSMLPRRGQGGLGERLKDEEDRMVGSVEDEAKGSVFDV